MKKRYIKITDGIVYLPIPKCASTTIKQAICKWQNGFDDLDTDESGKHRIHNYYSGKLISPWKIKRNDFVFCVLRDPIERFLSAYKNRVVFYRELRKENISSKKIRDKIDLNRIPYNPSISEFIENLDTYYLVPSIKHHFAPLTKFTENNINRFTKIYMINELKLLQTDLVSKGCAPISFDRMKTGDPDTKLSELSPREFQFLLDFYHKDYQLFHEYISQSTISEKYLLS